MPGSGYASEEDEVTASVIKVGVAYVGICVSRRLKEELACVTDKYSCYINKYSYCKINTITANLNIPQYEVL